MRYRCLRLPMMAITPTARRIATPRMKAVGGSHGAVQIRLSGGGSDQPPGMCAAGGPHKSEAGARHAGRGAVLAHVPPPPPLIRSISHLHLSPALSPTSTSHPLYLPPPTLSPALSPTSSPFTGSIFHLHLSPAHVHPLTLHPTPYLSVPRANLIHSTDIRH